MDNFKVGEEVEFELDITGTMPRWDLDYDRRGSGIFAKGKVINCTLGDFIITYGNKDSNSWIWFQPSVRPDLYSLPGCLRRIDNGVIKDIPTNICACDIVKLWNYGHDLNCPEKRR